MGTSPPRAVEPLAVPPDTWVTVPGSKSITNRALVVAALASGRSELRGILLADDTEVMLGALGRLGAGLVLDRDTNSVVVTGTGGRIAGAAGGPAVELWAAQSGTTARFLLGLLPLGCGPYRLDGHDQLRRRPLGPMVEALGALGALVTVDDETGGLPLTADVSVAAPGSERVEPDHIAISGHVSSQFVSGLLLGAPCRPDGLVIELTSAPVSVPYLHMTVTVMRSFGADVDVVVDDAGRPRLFRVAPGGYQGRGFDVEPDASAASYFFAAAAITGGRVGVRGLHRSSVQGDTGFVDVLAAMGASVDDTADGLTVRGPAALTGVDQDLGSMSDTVPTLAAVAPFATSPTTVSGVGFIRDTKESDRVAVVVTELRRMGVRAEIVDDGFVVHPGEPAPALIETYDDHRIAMAFALIGLRQPGVVIDDPDCSAKTFPGYFEALDQLRRPGDADDADPAPAATGLLSEELRVIALDGPAGSGKSTVAKAVADRLGLEYLDTGAMYRAVAFAALHAGVAVDAADRVADISRRIDLSVTRAAVTVDGVDATSAIRGTEVTAVVSVVAANPEVRAEMRRRQREWAIERGGGVLEGRDIGTVVFPDAALKVYLTARPEVRAARRAAEVAGDVQVVAADLARRDRLDSTRADSPLPSEEAVPDGVTLVDTSDLDIDQVVDQVVNLLHGR